MGRACVGEWNEVSINTPVSTSSIVWSLQFDGVERVDGHMRLLMLALLCFPRSEGPLRACPEERPMVLVAERLPSRN